MFLCIREAGLTVCLQRSDVNSGVGRDWYGGRSQGKHRENYKMLLQARTSDFKVRSSSISAFVTLITQYMGETACTCTRVIIDNIRLYFKYIVL